jgi:hypothetical protein
MDITVYRKLWCGSPRHRLFCANILLPLKIIRFSFPLTKMLYFMLGTDSQERSFLGLKLSEKKFQGGGSIWHKSIYTIYYQSKALAMCSGTEYAE